MLSDIEIAQQCKMEKITDIAAKLGIAEEDIEDLSCENEHLVKKFDSFIREKKNTRRRPRNEKVK